MILIEIDSLTDNELRYIAQKENIEDFETLDRCELIDQLKEIYDEDDDYNIEHVNKKFISTIYSPVTNKSTFKIASAIHELPELYNETSIHLLTKNASWLYCFWSISSLDSEKYNTQLTSYSLVLNITLQNENEIEDFDIDISLNDNDWNINVPHMSGKCIVKLQLVKDNDRITLAESLSIDLINMYWLSNPDEIQKDKFVIKRFLSSLISKDGNIVTTAPVRKIVEIVENEGDINV